MQITSNDASRAIEWLTSVDCENWQRHHPSSGHSIDRSPSKHGNISSSRNVSPTEHANKTSLQIVFSLALLKSSPAAWPYYKHCTLELLRAKIRTFPNAEFVVHLNEEASAPDTTAELRAAAGDKIRLISYRFNRKCQPWLVAAMRLSTLFDCQYKDKAVSVVDVHDDQRMQVGHHAKNKMRVCKQANNMRLL